jgi:crotonobetainyl-CoA:carnitine CoA-transferase CaiB-like acyl-CoA transferase
VIAAPNDVTFDVSFAERHRAMAATIFERAEYAGLCAEKNDRFPEKFSAEEMAARNVIRETGDVPHIT